MKIKHIVSILTLIIITFITMSCKNFMQGKDFVEELENLVWISSKEQPTAKIISPVFAPNGDYKNASIIIKFSQPIKPETFEEGFTVTNSTGDSLREYYCDPQWDEEGSQVTLIANETNQLPIATGNFMDITLTISCKVKNTEDVPLESRVIETYKLNSTIDKEKPYFVYSQAAINWETFSEEVKDDEGNVITNPKLFIEGEITDENQDELFLKNHIARQIFFGIIGHDYGGNKVFANIKYSRVFDVDGNAVEEASNTILGELVYYNEYTLDWNDNIYVGLWENIYSDGIYKFEVSLVDTANNVSEETKVFYVVRDTNFYLNPYSYAQTWIPSYRPEEQTDIPQTITAMRERLSTFSIYDYSDDVYVTYKGKKYSTPMQAFTYTLSYGLSKNDPDMVKDLNISEMSWINEEGKYLDIYFPQSYMDFMSAHKDHDIYAAITTTDAVGNSRTREIYHPKQPKYFGYTYDENTNSITLNFEDQSSITNTDIKIYNISVRTQYRIHYAEKTSSNIEEIPLTRNFLLSYQDDLWDEYTGKTTFNIDPSKEYIAVILPSYVYFYSYYTIGRTYSEPIIINNISSKIDNTPPVAPTITSVQKQTPKDSSGLTTIEITADLPQQNGVTYYYGWSEDGINWSYFANNKFVIPTLLKPPVQNWAALDGEVKLNNGVSIKNDTDVWNIRDFVTNNQGSRYDYNTTGYAAVFASKGALTTHSNFDWDNPNNKGIVTFNSIEDDNIPPEQDKWVKSHNITMSADGKYFVSGSVVYDKEWNDFYSQLYHYAPYSSLWGDNLNFYTKEEIWTTPWTYTKTKIDCWIEESTSPHELRRNNSYFIPINGLSDGEYMFFYNYNDHSGNNNTGVLGKAHIGTYQNKPVMKYDKSTGKISATLDVAANEILENNKVFFQYVNKDDKNYWVNATYVIFDNDKYVLKDESTTWQAMFCTKDMVKNGNSLTFTSSGDIHIEQNTFYKVTATGYNHDKTTGLFYNMENGYVDCDEKTSGYLETRYDMYTDEIASVASYMYIGDYNNYEKTMMERNSGQISSTIPVLVQVYSSITNLGSDIDAWERRGNLLDIRMYDKLHFPNEVEFKSDPDNTYNNQKALEVISNQTWLKNSYYVIIARFANGEEKISTVYEIN